MAGRKRDGDRPLTRRQLKFVQYYAAMAHGTKAAIAAGYAAGSAHVEASRLLRHPAVLAELRAETERRLHAAVALAGKVLTDLAENAMSESVRLGAANRLLDQSGLQIVKLAEVRHMTDSRTDAELREALRALLARAKDLGVVAPMIDGSLEALPSPNREEVGFDTLE